ncbi:uncharacterized protein METZ01_LOCUS338372, partial [marine metagenome]
VTGLNGHPKVDFLSFYLFILLHLFLSKPHQSLIKKKILLLDVYIIAATKHAAPLDGP